MPLKVETMAEQRRRIVQRIRSGNSTVTEIAQETGLNRKTIYQYLTRADDPEDSLADRSRRPHHLPTKTPAAVELLVMEVAMQYPVWGESKVRQECLRQYPAVRFPSARTVGRIMDRYGHHPGGQHTGPQGWQRFETPAPNSLWQMDFKGWFRTTDRRTIHPLSVLDDHSRFLLGLEACTNQTRETVWASLTRLFDTYGLPERMLTDNAGPWGAPGERAPTGLAIWLMRLGIALIHGRPYHPQTQGKVERFHRTLKAELLARSTFPTVADTQHQFDLFRATYNTRRIHQAVRNRYPADVYRVSGRPYPHVLVPPEYPDAIAIRKVGYNGTISYANHRLRVHNLLGGEYVGLYPTEEGDIIDIMYYRTTLRTVDLRELPTRT